MFNKQPLFSIAADALKEFGQMIAGVEDERDIMVMVKFH